MCRNLRTCSLFNFPILLWPLMICLTFLVEISIKVAENCSFPTIVPTFTSKTFLGKNVNHEKSKMKNFPTTKTESRKNKKGKFNEPFRLSLECRFLLLFNTTIKFIQKWITERKAKVLVWKIIIFQRQKN